MRRKLLGPEHADVAVTLAELGRVYQDQGLNERAEPLHREALDIRRKVLGDDHRETAVSESDLASVLRLNGDLAGAEALLRLCLRDERKTRGEDHPNTFMTLHDLALMRRPRATRAAESLLRQVLAMQRKTLGDRHPIVAATLNSLSRVLLDQQRYDEAAAALQEAPTFRAPPLGRDHQLVAIYTINLAAVRLAQKDPAAAEPLLREGLRIRALAPGPRAEPPADASFEDDWSVGATKSLLGAALVALARYDEAEAVLLDARRDLESLRPLRGAEMKATVARLVDLYVAWGKPDAAASFRALLQS